MPRKKPDPRTPGPDWFLADWMDALKVKQADLMREIGWGKARASEIVNGKTEYYREIVNQAATALKIEPFELLLHPEVAFHIRRLRAAVETEHQLRAVAEARDAFTPAPAEDEPLNPKRKVS